MARCVDCLHFDICDYNTNIAGDGTTKLFYDEGAEKCSFFKVAADFKEVKCGEWVLPTGALEIFDGKYVICSECNVMIPIMTELPIRAYCPHCGAKMDISKTEITTDGGDAE